MFDKNFVDPFDERNLQSALDRSKNASEEIEAENLLDEAFSFTVIEEDVLAENLDADMEVFAANAEEPAVIEDNKEDPALALKSLVDDDVLNNIDIDDMVKMYIKEATRVPLLTGEEEVELAQRIERGPCVSIQNPVARRRKQPRAGEQARHHNAVGVEIPIQNRR